MKKCFTAVLEGRGEKLGLSSSGAHSMGMKVSNTTHEARRESSDPKVSAASELLLAQLFATSPSPFSFIRFFVSVLCPKSRFSIKDREVVVEMTCSLILESVVPYDVRGFVGTCVLLSAALVGDPIPSAKSHSIDALVELINNCLTGDTREFAHQRVQLLQWAA